MSATVINLVQLLISDCFLQIEAKNPVRDTLRVFNMKDGGHYAFLASSDLLVKEIEKLVNMIRLKE